MVTLRLPIAGLDRFKSASQRARIGTESWGAENFFCPVCDSPQLRSAAQGTAAVDYFCPLCSSPFQLKSQSKPFGARIVDAAYSEMKKAILEDRTPNLYVLHYDLAAWSVKTLILIPQFAFSLSAVERRKPLAATARRAGWVGCNILLARIPPEARIPLVLSGVVSSRAEVRKRYARLKPLSKLDTKQRGWTLDVLSGVRSLGKHEFTLAEAYALEPHLSSLHPNNHNVGPKIRQQLQVLRDLGFLEFLDRGRYRLR